jgi:hypothetical protein
MLFKHVDIEGALRRLADRRIEDAMKEGKFDNLPGSGRPIELEPMPAEEDARLTWWALRILRNNNIVPEEVRWRKLVDHLKRELSRTVDQRRVESLVTQINALVHRLNTLGTNALSSSGAVVAVDMEAELARLQQRCNDSNPMS